MALTLKQIVTRIKSLAQSHKQINTVFVGDLEDFLTTSKDVVYPACVISVGRDSSIDIINREHQYNLSVQLFDLQMVADKSGQNDLELQSDLSSIAEDLISLINLNEYLQEWITPETYTLRVSTFQLNDVCTGVVFELPISSIYNSDVCQVPSDVVNFPTDDTMKIVENYIYNGAEVETFTVSSLKNKTILLVLNGVQPLTPTTGMPTPDQYRYTASTGQFEFGTYVKSVQILNRNI